MVIQNKVFRSCLTQQIQHNQLIIHITTPGRWRDPLKNLPGEDPGDRVHREKKKQRYPEMLKKSQNHPPRFFWNHSPSSTPEPSPTSSSSDSEFDEDMDSTSGSRPISFSVPRGAYGPMRPSLEQVLANTAPAPYTLSAFMAYLSQNHCLETLEFTLEAKRYRETFEAVTHQLGEYPSANTDFPECQHLCMLWQRLLTAYILPGSPREINVTSDVRDNILRQAAVNPPPHPQVLDVAVKLTHELMEESIFMPFLNSHSTSAYSAPSCSSEFSPCSDDGVMVLSKSSFEEHHTEKRSRSKSKRLTPPSSAKELGPPFAASSHSGKSNFTLSMMTSLGKSAHRSGQTPSPGGNDLALTDDSGSNASMGELMTPPTTPPSTDPFPFLSQSPKNRTENPWKKMGMMLGFKKRSGNANGSRDMKIFGMDD